ncbi:MAG: hypothetical protein II574_10820, partial [Ruminococcus sp.]|nr:hypothetical protein [Ruminococcus sp.]
LLRFFIDTLPFCVFRAACAAGTIVVKSITQNLTDFNTILTFCSQLRERVVGFAQNGRLGFVQVYKV